MLLNEKCQMSWNCSTEQEKLWLPLCTEPGSSQWMAPVFPVLALYGVRGWWKRPHRRLWPLSGPAGQKTMQGRWEDKPWHLKAGFASSAELLSGSTLLAKATSRQRLNQRLSHHRAACCKHHRSSGWRARCQHPLNSHWFSPPERCQNRVPSRKAVTFPLSKKAPTTGTAGPWHKDDTTPRKKGHERNLLLFVSSRI